MQISKSPKIFIAPLPPSPLPNPGDATDKLIRHSTCCVLT